ncbi:MAG: NAD-dependent epimerase/dehydratase family protein [Candidatus Kapaibacterium sp.]|jgi:UDP-glucose 4-epimerase
MKIIVTGGAGFIGSHIVDAYCALGHDVVILDNFSSGKIENCNPKARIITMDITAEAINDLFEKERFDVLNHHAAQMDVRVSVNDPQFDASTNILGGLNLYEAAKKNGVKKIIFASSGGTVYGEQQEFPASEDHPKQPLSPYGISKLANEHYLYYYKQEYGIPSVILRYANIYGPRQNPHGEAGVVAIFTNKLLAGQEPVINGDGLQTRDYVFVSDVVQANIHALSDTMEGAFNIGTEKETDVVTIFRHLNDIIGGNSPEKYGAAKPGEQRRSVISHKKIKEHYGWMPTVSFREGLEKTVEFFQARL